MDYILIKKIAFDDSTVFYGHIINAYIKLERFKENLNENKAVKLWLL